MNGLLFADWTYLPFIVLVLIISFTLHEFAHAYSAYKLGDSTAYDAGRVTLNPMVHLDIFGSIMLLLVGFGWAKPVPVNRGNFKNPRLMGIIVSVAGPFSNLILAFIGVFFIYLFQSNDWLNHMSLGSASAINAFTFYLVTINLVLLLFNLLPIPPLDGYRVLQDVLPLRATLGLQKYEQWASFIILLFVFIEPLRNVTLVPLFNLRYPILDLFNIPMKAIFGSAIEWRLFF
ncbi:site-2 protease family protein [Paenibacillus eucommiae]|uniref:Zn-dependent protease n=1 Tax=Paenibacillus eucommiae TaxID=1355755 RepID=A0ABS4IZ54_9BACL|nr:site-2 protease family protein [Paenibacillus eucommiae]MBP1992869.1 Zn-dependent protease [Paenibacillus eucommiae]